MARDALIVDGDLVRTTEGDFFMIEDLAELAQSTRIEMGAIRGTYVDDRKFDNVRLIRRPKQFGVPFLEVAFRKAPDLALFGAIIRATLELRPDILAVIEFLPGFNFSTRQYTLTWKAETTQGLLDAVT